MSDDWTHPLKLTREELEELVVVEMKKRNMLVKGPVRFVIGGGHPPTLEGAEVEVVVRPVPGSAPK